MGVTGDIAAPNGAVVTTVGSETFAVVGEPEEKSRSPSLLYLRYVNGLSWPFISIGLMVDFQVADFQIVADFQVASPEALESYVSKLILGFFFQESLGFK